MGRNGCTGNLEGPVTIGRLGKYDFRIELQPDVGVFLESAKWSPSTLKYFLLFQSSVKYTGSSFGFLKIFYWFMQFWMGTKTGAGNRCCKLCGRCCINFCNVESRVLDQTKYLKHVLAPSMGCTNKPSTMIFSLNWLPAIQIYVVFWISLCWDEGFLLTTLDYSAEISILKFAFTN